MRLAQTSLLLLALVPTMARGDENQDAVLRHGLALAKENCSRCHAIDISGDSPEKQAIPFRDMAKDFDAEELEDALNEGVPTQHPLMPDWQMTPEQAHALATYIMSLSPYGKDKADLGGPGSNAVAGAN